MAKVKETSTAKSFVYPGKDKPPKANTQILVVRGSAKALKEAEELLRLQNRVGGIEVAKW